MWEGVRATVVTTRGADGDTGLAYGPCVSLHVTFHVQRQMIRAGEATITVAAFERFCARVLAIMTRQFI